MKCKRCLRMDVWKDWEHCMACHKSEKNKEYQKRYRLRHPEVVKRWSEEARERRLNNIHPCFICRKHRGKPLCGTCSILVMASSETIERIIKFKKEYQPG